MTFREFTGKNVEEAIRSAMAEFSADLGDLDIEILAQGSRGILGVGGEEARILAAPKSAVAAAETIRSEPVPPAPLAESPAPAVETFTDEPMATEAPMETMETIPSPEDQVAELERAARSDLARRPRGGRGRGGRGRNGREREHGIREPRADRPPREPRADRSDRPAREPAPFVSGKPLEELSDEERATLHTARTVLTE